MEQTPAVPDQSEHLTRQWQEFLTGTSEDMVRLRRRHSRIPSSPRCKMCLVPFAGPGGFVMRRLGFKRWGGNPNLCTNCFRKLEKSGVGGAEVPTTIFFADARNSTSLAEQMSPAEFRRLMQRFYVAAGDSLSDNLAIIDKFVGDGAIGIFVPGITGPNHARLAIEAARAVLARTGHGNGSHPWLPVGVGVHTGVTFVGTVGVGQEVRDITALGDVVNTTARLSGAAGDGEILISDATAEAARVRTAGLEHRWLDLKGKTGPVGAYVLHLSDPIVKGEAD